MTVYISIMAYVLHYAPDNASLIVRLTLEEMGLPYQTVLVNRAAQAQDSAAYRRINPAGLIPALETPQGVMFETAAILLWLADTHGKMAPAPDNPMRARFLSMLFFVSNTLHAQMRMQFYPSKYVGTDQSAQDALRRQLQTDSAPDMTLRRGLALLDAYVADDTGAPGQTPSILHCYACALVRWCALYPLDRTAWFALSDYPALHRCAATQEDRAAALTVARAEGLGPTPFTAPHYPRPPEGSAL